MSLYNYVPTKDHLIQLMIDMAGGEYRYPNLAAALAASSPSRERDADEVFDSCVRRLIDGALPG